MLADTGPNTTLKVYVDVYDEKLYQICDYNKFNILCTLLRCYRIWGWDRGRTSRSADRSY